MLDFEIKGLDELSNSLDEIKQRANSISGPVKLSELFPDDFIHDHTGFNTIDDLVAESNQEANFRTDFNGLKNNASWNHFISENTQFPNWEEMVQSALFSFIARKLGF
jgi:hypothetical protein